MFGVSSGEECCVTKVLIFPGGGGKFKCSNFYSTRNLFNTRVSDCNVFLVCGGLKTLSYFSSPPHDIRGFFSHNIFNACPFFIPFTQKAVKNISSILKSGWPFGWPNYFGGDQNFTPIYHQNSGNIRFSDSLALSIILLL